MARIHCGRRPDQLWAEPNRHVPQCWYLHGEDPQRRETGRSAGSAADALRARRQSQNRQGARPHHPAIDTRPRRRGHRVMWRGVFLLALLLVQLWVVPDSVAQAPEKVYRLGVLSVSPGTLQRMRAVMFPELARLGFTEGRNLV